MYWEPRCSMLKDSRTGRYDEINSRLLQISDSPKINNNTAKKSFLA